MLFFKCGIKGLFLSLATESHCKNYLPKPKISEGTTSCISSWLENSLTYALEHRLYIWAAGIISLESRSEPQKSLCLMHYERSHLSWGKVGCSRLAEAQHAKAAANHWTFTGKALGKVVTHNVLCVHLMIGQTKV